MFGFLKNILRLVYFGVEQLVWLKFQLEQFRANFFSTNLLIKWVFKIKNVIGRHLDPGDPCSHSFVTRDPGN